MFKLQRRTWIILWIGLFLLMLGALAISVIRTVQIKTALEASGYLLGGGARMAEATSVYTGEGITNEQAQKRALGVMIAGDTITRPQSGLGLADIVVEMEAAMGITRYLAIFQSVYPEEIGSIRSARNDYIDLAAGFDAPLVHWGGEKKALDRLANSTTDEIDQFANGDLFYRKLEIPAPHNGFTSAELMEQGLERYNYQRTPRFDVWTFKTDAPESERPDGGSLKIVYGNLNFDVVYEYNSITNRYERYQGGEPHKDALTNQIIAPKNVLVVRADHFTYSAAGGYLQFDFVSGGDCSMFQNGEEISCTWDKGGNENNPLTIQDTSGRPLDFVVGKTWIEVVLPTAEVDWTPQENSDNINR